MLMAFHTTEPDSDGSQFKAVRDMIHDAWDVRASRMLCENGLIEVEHPPKDSKGIAPSSIWRITDKGRLIALAILEDTETLQRLNIRGMGPSYRLVEDQAHKDWLNRKEKKRHGGKAA